MQNFSLSRKAVDSRPQSILGACRWRLAMGAVRFGLEGTAPSWSRTYGLVLRAATRTQGIMARKELPEERAQAKVDSRPQSILGACRWRLAMGAVRFGLEGTAPSWSRTYGLVLRAATRTQGIMAAMFWES